MEEGKGYMRGESKGKGTGVLDSMDGGWRMLEWVNVGKRLDLVI